MSPRGSTRPPSAATAARDRIFIGTLDARLIALDGRNGRPCAHFGAAGAVDLANGVDARDRGDYLVTSPPAIYRDLVIVGSAIGDNRAVELERGIVRAFDARTGAAALVVGSDSDERCGGARARLDRRGATTHWRRERLVDDVGR